MMIATVSKAKIQKIEEKEKIILLSISVNTGVDIEGKKALFFINNIVVYKDSFLAKLLSNLDKSDMISLSYQSRFSKFSNKDGKEDFSQSLYLLTLEIFSLNSEKAKTAYKIEPVKEPDTKQTANVNKVNKVNNDNVSEMFGAILEDEEDPF